MKADCRQTKFEDEERYDNDLQPHLSSHLNNPNLKRLSTLTLTILSFLSFLPTNPSLSFPLPHYLYFIPENAVNMTD